MTVTLKVTIIYITMDTLTTLANDFLSQRTIAIVGISNKPQALANSLYKKLKTPQRSVVAIHPTLTTFDGDVCYPNLQSIPFAIDGVFIAAKPENTERIVEECIALNIPRVWMHYSFGLQHSEHRSAISSVSSKAVERCRLHHISVIPGACPMMFLEQRDPFHSCLRWLLSVTGKMDI
jgi:predicted CoA-binding protein